MNFISSKSLITIVVIASVIGSFLYFFVIKEPTVPDPNLESFSVEQIQIQSELLSTLRNIQSIRLDRSLFDDPVFKSLVDFGQPLVGEPVGRANPFAPIEVVNESQNEELEGIITPSSTTQ